MKTIAILFASMLAITSFAEEGKAVAEGADASVKKPNRQTAMMRRTGGLVRVPGKQKGGIVVVDAKSGADKASVKEVADTIGKKTRIQFDIEEGTFDIKNVKLRGEATLFLVDDEALPMSLVAPEGKWAMVNMAPLKKGRGSNEAFAKARTKKEMTRALCYLMGAANSTYPDALVSCVTKPEDLDAFANADITFDVEMKLAPYCKGYGILPYEETTYRNACKEGWAPQPTNDYQRVIWEEFHSKPTEPMRIKFDPKQGI